MEYLNNSHFLVFYISEIGQLQLSYILQGVRISFFTLSKLINIILKSILSF